MARDASVAAETESGNRSNGRVAMHNELHVYCSACQQQEQQTSFYWSACDSRRPQLRSGGLCWSKVLLPAFPC